MPDLDNDKSKEINITIDESLVFSDKAGMIKTRVPGTYGENIRFLMVGQSDVEYINNDKTILTSLKADKTYNLFDSDNKIAEKISGQKLFDGHYDPVNLNKNKQNEEVELVEDNSTLQNNEQKKNDEEKTNEVVEKSVANEEKAQSKTDEVQRDSSTIEEQVESTVQKKSELASREQLVRNSILAKAYDRNSMKIAECSDKIDLLNAKNQQSKEKIARSQAIVDKYKELVESGTNKSLPTPVVAFIKLVSDYHKNAIDSQKQKITSRNIKIQQLGNEIDKSKARIEGILKADTFISNMRTPEGRKDNFIHGLEALQKYAYKRNENKIERSVQQLQQMNNAYEHTTSAVEKLRLSKDIPSQRDKIDNLLKQRKSLTKSLSSIDKLKTFDNKAISQVINKSYKELSNNEILNDNPTYKVTVVCKNNIEQTEKVAKIEKENYLKNAEINVEGNYDMIDGMINNLPPQKDNAEKEDKAFKVKPQILSRKEIVSVGKKQKEMQQKNKEKTQERTPER